MGIGLQIIIITLFLLGALTILLLSIYFSDKFELAKGMKYLILYSFAGFTIVFILLFVIGFTGQVLDNIFPSRIFESSFQFESKEEVKNLNGSLRFFSENGNGKRYLEFTTNKEVVKKILVNRIFVKRNKERFSKSNIKTVKNLAKKEGLVFYISGNFRESCSNEFTNCIAYLAHNEKTGEVYFVW